MKSQTLGTINWILGLIAYTYTIINPNLYSLFIGTILVIFGLACSSDRRKK